jgi:hypothetical protein
MPKLLAFVCLLIIGITTASAQSAKPAESKVEPWGVSSPSLFLKDTAAVRLNFTVRRANCAPQNKTYFICRVQYAIGNIVDPSGASKTFTPLFALPVTGKGVGTVETVIQVMALSTTELTLTFGLPERFKMDDAYRYDAQYLIIGTLN